MAKIADVWGRLEAFSLSVLLYTVGYIQQAGANSVKTYAAAQIFYAAGQTGLQILQQIFIADTSDLLNRAIVSTIPDIPYLLNVWIGPPIADGILKRMGWRWGYGIWSIILPIAFMPLALSLFLNQRKAAKRGLLPPSIFAGKGKWDVVKSLAIEMDFFGLLLLLAGVALILVPLSLAANTKGQWNNSSVIAMLVVGGLCLVAFPLWERSPRLAPRAFFPPTLVRNGTVLAGMAYAFFYFSKNCNPLASRSILTIIPQWLTISLSSHTSTPTCWSCKTRVSRKQGTLHKPSPLQPPSHLSSSPLSSNTPSTTSTT